MKTKIRLVDLFVFWREAFAHWIAQKFGPKI